MSQSHARQPLWIWIVMVLACTAALVFAGVVMRSFGTAATARKRDHTARPMPVAARPRPGVDAQIVAGPLNVTRTLPAMAFALQPGQSLDARLPSGPFEGRFTVTFNSGEVREARIGAEFQGGSLIISRGGQVLLSDFAGGQSKMALTTTGVNFSRGSQQLAYVFRADGEQPARLRALWQPDGSDVPLPLPSDGAPLVNDEALRGLVLAQEFNCAACHRSGSSTLQAQLAVSPAPMLGDAGQRLRPQWISRWLRDPQQVRAGAMMPRLFHGQPADEETIEDVAHFLVSMGGPLETVEPARDADLVATGMVHYHTVGCFACHGPLEPPENLPGGRAAVAVPLRSYSPLGDLASQTTQPRLAAFLKDPLHWRASGRMPSLNLDELEARSIAAYLMARTSTPSAADTDEAAPAQWAVDAQRAQRGRGHFASLGCANCHALGPDRTVIEPSLEAPPLEELAHVPQAGCLASVDPGAPTPRFSFSNDQRRQLAAFLQSIAQRACDDVPVDRLAATMSRLNCVACHAFEGERGPERAIAQYFTTVTEADLGDEGRVPPDLSDVGAKLDPQWMDRVLAQRGQARPYMGARMPQFGAANVDELPRLLTAAAGKWPVADHGPAASADYAAMGRELVGVKGLNCIECHNIAGHDATGTPGPDLADVPERLRYDAFARWLHDPAMTRPGTRMPSFFVEGRSAFTDVLEGDADRQIEAMWAYLSQGRRLPPPEGAADAGGLVLSVVDQPIVFRTFMDQAGVRAIACGFPEQIHCAFDAEKCRLAVIWEGEFINAKGAWAARGGMPTNPQAIAWKASHEPAIRIFGLGGTWPDEAERRFRGYRLDARRRPIFMYDISFGDVTVSVEEQPLPQRDGGRAKLIRRFAFQGEPGLTIEVQSASTTICADGRAELEVEMTW